jgi:hypothetical protein
MVAQFNLTDAQVIKWLARAGGTVNSVHKPFRQVAVGVNPPVAEERPVRARGVHVGEVHGHK